MCFDYFSNENSLLKPSKFTFSSDVLVIREFLCGMIWWFPESILFDFIQVLGLYGVFILNTDAEGCDNYELGVDNFECFDFLSSYSQ